jgi:restriction endonuclease S subunit
MDGLEATEQKLSYVTRESEAFRVDSDYYKKEYIKAMTLLKSKAYENLENVALDIKSFGAYSLCNDVVYFNEGIPFLRCVNIKNGRVDFSNVLYINDEANRLLWKSEIKPKMILLTMSGSIGSVAIAQENWNYPINSNQDIAKIEIDNKINPYYVYVFLNSLYGQRQLNREQVGSVQQHIFIWQIGKLIIPIISDDFENKIEELVRQAYEMDSKAEGAYKRAEEILINELDINISGLDNDNKSVRKLSESFGVVGRLDAEYYQPIYEEIAGKIKVYSNGSSKISEICNLYDANFEPSPEVLYKYIELSNINPYGEINGYTHDLGKHLPTRARRLVRNGQVIVSSIEGSLNKCAYVAEEYNNALCSTGFYVVDSRYINPESLCILFKSKPIQALLKQKCSGTILTSIGKSEFSSIELPILRDSIQKDIRLLVNKSILMRTRSTELLDIAKKAVEFAIEQGESKAMEYLSEYYYSKS